MCGLAGFARLDGSDLDARADAILAAMAEAVAHRGPDEKELRRDGPVGLAFTRLSLVDPASGGQPLTSDDGSVVLIANGEVYNHRELAATLPADTRLRTRSDCEVLVHLYQREGLNFLDKVRGMFGLILWDRRKGRLILARDRFGIKPLYFHRNRERIAFSSEIKALFVEPGTPRQLDWEAALTHPLFSAAPYLADTPPTTWFKDIAYVPAGSIVEIDLRDGSTREHRYWRFPGPGREIPDSDDDLIDEYAQLLAASVADCATADAEIGLFLSGGVDSAAVAALAAQVGPLHTFTVLTGSTYVNGDAENACFVAGHLGLPNHQVIFSPDRVPGAAEWKRLLWLLETPQCGPEQFYKHELHRYAKLARPGIKGMLLGAASDEFNGGYSTEYIPGGDWNSFMAQLHTMRRRGALRARPDLAPWWEYFVEPVFSDAVVTHFVGSSPRGTYDEYLSWEYTKVQQYNCWHEDRTAAGSGIEARVPFLDHRLVELVAAIPPGRRERLLWDKRIVRDAVRGLLPIEIVEREKVPFYYGDGLAHTYRTFVRMLAQDGAALVEEALAAPNAREFLDSDGVRAALRQLERNPGVEQAELLLRVVNLGLLDDMVNSMPAPMVKTSPGPSPRAVEVVDWATSRESIEQMVFSRPRLDPRAVPRFGEHVLLLHSPTDEDTWYIAVEGTMEFVIDATESVDWLRFLRTVDGIHDLGGVIERAGCEIGQVQALLHESLEQGVLVLEPLASSSSTLPDATLAAHA